MRAHAAEIQQECYSTDSEENYKGKYTGGVLSSTVDQIILISKTQFETICKEKECVRWNSKENKSKYKWSDYAKKFNDGTNGDHNYCRNESPTGTPWCVTTDGFLYCKMEKCSSRFSILNFFVVQSFKTAKTVNFSGQNSRNVDFDFGRTSYQAKNTKYDTNFDIGRNIGGNRYETHRASDHETDCWGESKNHYLGSTTYQGCINWTSAKVSLSCTNGFLNLLIRIRTIYGRNSARSLEKKTAPSSTEIKWTFSTIILEAKLGFLLYAL